MIEKNMKFQDEELELIEGETVESEKKRINLLKQQNRFLAERIRNFVELYLPSQNKTNNDNYSVNAILEKLINLYIFGKLNGENVIGSYLSLDFKHFSKWDSSVQILNKFGLIIVDASHNNRINLFVLVRN